jgi:hypothetical protein
MNRTLVRVLSVGLMSGAVTLPSVAARAQNDGANETPAAPDSAPTRAQDPFGLPRDQPMLERPYALTPRRTIAIPAPPPDEAPAAPLRGPPLPTAPSEEGSGGPR